MDSFFSNVETNASVGKTFILNTSYFSNLGISLQPEIGPVASIGQCSPYWHYIILSILFSASLRLLPLSKMFSTRFTITVYETVDWWEYWWIPILMNSLSDSDPKDTLHLDFILSTALDIGYTLNKLNNISNYSIK